MWKSLRVHSLALVLLLAIPGAAHAEEETAKLPLSAAHAVVLGLVEGFTEFLPVSSTGHLLLAERALKISENAATKQAMDTYLIVIQMGAILAVAWVYHDYLKRMALGLLGKDPEGFLLLKNLSIAFCPAALVGVIFVDRIKQSLFGLWPVSLAWLIGGVALLFLRKKTDHEDVDATCCLETMTTRQALLIGIAQVIAMWPGTSRSLVTILAGKGVGLSLRNSVIFSFLLGMITLSASTCYDLYQNGEQMIELLGLQSLVIGLIAAYLSAWAAVRGMVQYLKKHGMGLFAGYRIALAGITAGLLLTGVLTP